MVLEDEFTRILLDKVIQNVLSCLPIIENLVYSLIIFSFHQATTLTFCPIHIRLLLNSAHRS